MTQNLKQATTKPRILLAGHLPPPMGGIATYYQSLLNSSLPKQVNLRFVETSSQNRTLSQSGKASFSNLISAIRDWGRFTQAVVKHQPQLTHIATSFGLSFAKHSVCVIIARLFGSRVLLHPHCGIAMLYTNQPKWWQWFFRQIIKLTNGVVVLSTEWKLLSSIIPACSVYFLPNAIDLIKYREIALERLAARNNTLPFKVLYLGYVGKAKGSLDLVDVANEIELEGLKVMLSLVGDEVKPGEGELLNQKIKDAGLNGSLVLLPSVEGARKLALLREADIFIYPSYSEGMPIAVIEAMACGLPIIATKVGGLPDLIMDGVNGLLVDVGRPDQLATAIQKLMSDPELRFSMQKKSYQLAFEKYNVEQLVPRLVSIYKTTLTRA